MLHSGVAKAPGADLYFERRGDGPVLLLIVGGGGDCASLAPIAELLAGHYTVISYDRRGNSRSTLGGPARPMSVAEQGNDAIAVLDATGVTSARIFGNSGGATIALDLAARHPDRLVAAVAHEPPVPRVLPEGDQILRDYADLERTLRVEGWEA
ncbi:MAG: alpha/beta fold hydrolase, partial [Actinomycetota bacterium]